MSLHIRKIKLKSGTAHQVYYREAGNQKTKYFPPEIPFKYVRSWSADKKRELAFIKAGLQEYYQRDIANSISLSDIPNFLREERTGFVSESTLYRNIGAVQYFVQIVGDMPCTSVSKNEVSEFIKSRLRSGFEHGGINNDLRNLRTVFGLLVSKNIVFENPFEGERLSEPKKELEPLTPAEIEKMYECLDTDMIRDAFQIVRYTGCRRRSIAVKTGFWSNVLEWQEVDFDNGYIPIIQKASHRKIIPLHPELRKHLLQRYIQLGRPTGPIVSYYADTVTRKFKKAFKKAGIKKKLDPVHGLRHTAATKLAEAGCTASDIQVILGWESIEMAERYVHLTMERKKSIITNL